jgi:flagellar basal-body rod protein FlgC
MSDLEKAIQAAAMGMRAQGTRMKVISQNIANAGTTGRSPEEDPYRRQLVTFKTVLDRTKNIDKVVVDKILPDRKDFSTRYDPSHPAANAQGYVRVPNVNTLIEMSDMREAQRSYEANLGVVEMSRSMLMRTIDMLGR